MKSEKVYSKFIRWFLERPKTTGLLTFVILIFVTAFVIEQKYQLTKDQEQSEMIHTLEVVHKNIEQALKNYQTATLTLALTINDDGIPENFNYVSKKLIEANKSIFAVQLVPNGVIKYIYPLESNKAALDLNILESPYLKKEALKSITTGKVYFAGPLKLKQGGMGIVGRFPIFLNNKFWGFSAVVIKLETFLDLSGIQNIDTEKYYFQFSKFDSNLEKEVYYLSNQSDFALQSNVSTRISDGDWKLYLISKNKNYLYSQLLIPSILGIILASLLGILVYTLLKIPRELQSLVHTQASKLIDSELKFQSIFDQAAVGIAHIDAATGHFFEINNQFCQMLGYSQQEMKGKSFQSITHPDDLTGDLANLDLLLDGKISDYCIEKRYYTKNNTVVWVKLTVSPLLKKDKSLTSLISIVEDISLKKEAELLLQKNETRFKSLFDDSPLPLREEDFAGVKKHLQELELYGKTKDFVAGYFAENPQIVDHCHSLIKVINVNKASLKLYGVPHKDDLIAHKKDLFNSKSKNDFIKNLIAITQGKKQFVIDTIIKNAQGELRDINLRWKIVKGNTNTFDRVIVSTADITESLKTEKIVLETKQRVESLINTIDGIVWECDAQNFTFTFVSDKVHSILGYSPEEWLSNPSFWIENIHPEDVRWVQEYCRLKTREKVDHDFEYRMVAKNGSVIWLRDIVNIIYEKGKPISLRGIMIDITTAKEAERELKTSFNVVQEQNQRLLNFSYIVSHNLRSHTSNIASIVSLMESSESQEEKEEMVQLLKTVSNSLSETMLHLNEVINIRTNIGLLSELLNLKEYVVTATDVLKEQIMKNDVTILNTIPDHVTVNYNPAYLESILYNIISNSIRYRHAIRKPIISISVLFENNMKVLQISDNGIGIDLVKNSNKIFGMYKTFTSNTESKGIGLFITKNQIDAMGGNITVESEPNVGTTFKIYIQ